MSNPLRERLKDIFDRAMQTPQESRSTVLREMCGDDRRLYTRCAALLQSTAEPDRETFIKETISFVDETPVRGGRPADTIGPQRFAHFLLEREVARGGMGVVFRARDEKLDRTVALKMVLTGQLASEEEVLRFQTEAQAAAGLDHPNIVPVYESGEYEGRQYLAMAFVEGTSLQHKVKAGPLPPREAAELIAAIARAIHYAHERGVVHRDLKPSNVLLDRNGSPRVTDFGLAKRTETDSSLTATGQVMGTPSFMAPEQAAARQADIGPLSDVYALGAMLYVLLTGRPPFQAATVVETIQQLLENDPVSPRALNPAVPRDLETICLRCLAKEPDERFFSSADELADDLQRFLNDEPVRVRRLGTVARLGRWCRKTWQQRRRWVLATAGIVLLAVVALVVSLQVLERGRRDARFADLKSRFETGLKVDDWSAAHLREMDGLVESIEQMQSREGAVARIRLRERFTEVIQAAVRQPKIDADAVAQIETLLKLLEPRDRQSAEKLRTELADRKAGVESVFRLEPPFDSVGDVFNSRYVSVTGSGLQWKGRRSRWVPAFTKVADGDYVSLEAVFGPEWEKANNVGLVLNAVGGKGYWFELRTEPENRKALAPPFETVRADHGTFTLRIRHDNNVLQTLDVPAAKIPPGKLHVLAARDGQWLTVNVNNEHRLRFLDVFPAPAAKQRKFGVVWPVGVSLQRLYATRRVIPPAPSALEAGDRLYLARDYNAARAFYHDQALRSADAAEGLESHVKEALCLFAEKRLDEAGRLLQSAIHHPQASSDLGRPWRDVALAYLLLVRIRQKQNDGIEAVIQQMAVAGGGNKPDANMLTVVAPRAWRTEVMSYLRADTKGVGLLLYDPDRIRKLKLAVQFESVLGMNVRGTYTPAELIRALRAEANVPPARQTAEDLLNDNRNDSDPFIRHILREYGWMARTAYPPGAQRENAVRKALAELDRRLFRNPRAKDPTRRFRAGVHELLVERARLHASVGNTQQAAADLDDYFQYASTAEKSYRFYSAACLLRGYLYQDAGSPDKAAEFWKKAVYTGDLNVNALSTEFRRAGLVGIVHALIAAGLTNGWTGPQVEQFFRRAMKGNYSSPLVDQFMEQAKKAGFAPGVLTDMWRSPRGRAAARKIVFQSVPFQEFMRLPAVLTAAHFVYATALNGKPTDDQRRLIGNAFDEAIRKTFAGKIRFRSRQIIASGFVWLGFPTGWPFFRDVFPKPLRAEFSYILGLRYKELSRTNHQPAFRTQAETFFRDAVAGASGNRLLVRLAQAELNRAKAGPGGTRSSGPRKPGPGR